MIEQDPTMEQYLGPTSVMDSDHPEVEVFTERALDQARDPARQAQRLFYAVRDGVVFGPGASMGLSWRRVDQEHEFPSIFHGPACVYSMGKVAAHLRPATRMITCPKHLS